MHEIKTDLIKNRIYITFCNSDKIEMNEYVDKIEQACKRLIPGFTCIAIFRKDRPARQKENDLLFNTANLIYVCGASKIVQVTRNSSVSAEFQRVWMMQGDIIVNNAISVQEAEEILDETII